MIEKELEQLLNEARRNPELKQQLIKTRSAEDPVEEFCRLCQDSGYKNITVGKLFAVGLDRNDAKLRSVNGGGVNPIEGWDDAYEQFFTELMWL